MRYVNSYCSHCARDSMRTQLKYTVCICVSRIHGIKMGTTGEYEVCATACMWYGRKELVFWTRVEATDASVRVLGAAILSVEVRGNFSAASRLV